MKEETKHAKVSADRKKDMRPPDSDHVRLEGRAVIECVDEKDDKEDDENETTTTKKMTAMLLLLMGVVVLLLLLLATVKKLR
jgi:hypothetical protein